MKTKKLTQSALLLTLSAIIPYLFHIAQLPGKVLLPMHLPVLLAGFLVGPVSALIIGALAPVLNFLISGLPPLAILVFMICELAAYGLLAGLLHQKFNIFSSLILTMLGGRVTYGLSIWVGINFFDLIKFQNPLLMVKASLITGWPGILLQLIIIPTIIAALKKNSNKQIDFKSRV